MSVDVQVFQDCEADGSVRDSWFNILNPQGNIREIAVECLLGR